MNSWYLAKTVYGNTTVLGWTMNNSLDRERERERERDLQKGCAYFNGRNLSIFVKSFWVLISWEI